MIFYSIRNESGWAKGLYLAVSNGYTLGFGYPKEKDSWACLFSGIYILSGACAINAMILDLALSLAEEDKAWYKNAQLDHALKSASGLERIYAALVKNHSRLKFIYAFLIYVAMGWFWAINQFDYSIIKALHFSISLLSTAGAPYIYVIKLIS